LFLRSKDTFLRKCIFNLMTAIDEGLGWSRFLKLSFFEDYAELDRFITYLRSRKVYCSREEVLNLILKESFIPFSSQSLNTHIPAFFL